MAKSLDLLNPIVLGQFLNLKQLAKNRFGLDIICTNTLRSNEEQAALFAQGRVDLATVNAMRLKVGLGPLTAAQNSKTVTRARTAVQSVHGYGLAFDIAVVSPNGKIIIWDPTSDWNNDGQDDWAQIGSLADELGLEWGGNFSNYDAPHFQNRLGMTVAQLAAKYPPGETVVV